MATHTQQKKLVAKAIAKAIQINKGQFAKKYKLLTSYKNQLENQAKI